MAEGCSTVGKLDSLPRYRTDNFRMVGYSEAIQIIDVDRSGESKSRHVMLHFRGLGHLMLHFCGRSERARLKTNGLQRPHYAATGQITVQTRFLAGRLEDWPTENSSKAVAVVFSNPATNSGAPSFTVPREGWYSRETPFSPNRRTLLKVVFSFHQFPSKNACQAPGHLTP